MKQHELIRLPVIFDAGGNMSKNWFIEFYARNPRTGKMERQRIYKGINKYHSLKDRRAAAEKMQHHWIDKLKSGWSPFVDNSIIYDDNLEYQTYIKNYRKIKSTNGTFRYYSSKYLDSIKNKVEGTTISTYRSKLRLFDAWLEGKGINQVDISAINQVILTEFMTFIIEKRELSKVSVDNYRILLRSLFDYIRKEKNRKHFPNPCFDLPGTKKVNDSAAYPIYEDDICVFKNYIFKTDPQLWLVICFEYYCFLRPRKEIRLLKLSDIDFGRGMIHIRVENAKTTGRWVTIPKVFMKMMRETYNLHTYPRNLYVIGKEGKPGPDYVSINNLSNRFVRYRKELNMPEIYKLYSWKHTGNIRADKAGIPRQETQVQNGHTTLATTEKYMRNRGIVESFNILNNFPAL
jgi:integrase